MGIKRTKYSPEYKAEAVQLVRRSGRPVAQISRELGVHEVTLGKWVRMQESDSSDKSASEPLSSDERARLRQVETELARVKKENDCLKKAAAWFAAQNQ